MAQLVVVLGSHGSISGTAKLYKQLHSLPPCSPSCAEGLFRWLVLPGVHFKCFFLHRVHCFLLLGPVHAICFSWHLSHFKDRNISKSYYYSTISVHFGLTAIWPSPWWCWGVIAPDQGQPSYINRYIVYLLVAHRVQRDNSKEKHISKSCCYSTILLTSRFRIFLLLHRRLYHLACGGAGWLWL
jgi:hypothetical protein